jgi:hypothetical protein
MKMTSKGLRKRPPVAGPKLPAARKPSLAKEMEAPIATNKSRDPKGDKSARNKPVDSRETPKKGRSRKTVRAKKNTLVARSAHIKRRRKTEVVSPAKAKRDALALEAAPLSGPWKLVARDKYIRDIFHMTRESTYGSRELAVGAFHELFAKRNDVSNVWLISPKNERQDLKLDGIIVPPSVDSAPSPTRAGAWEIWNLDGPIVSGTYSYESAVATFNARWRSDPKAPNVFLVEATLESEAGRKPREQWLKRRGQVTG